MSKLDRLMDSEQRLVGAMSFNTTLRVDVKTDKLVETASMSLEGVQRVATTLRDVKAAMAGLPIYHIFPDCQCSSKCQRNSRIYTAEPRKP